jgi:DNA-binding transcriptional regulator YiaG
MKELAQEVRDLRLKLHLTQEDLASLLGASWMSIRWESGVHTPSFKAPSMAPLGAATRDRLLSVIYEVRG